MVETMVLHPQVVNRITHEHSYKHNTYVTDTYIRLFNATTYIQIKKIPPYKTWTNNRCDNV